MKFTLEVEMNNAAFDDSPISELVRILRDTAEEVEFGQLTPIVLHDTNGNAVGRAEIIE